jgi:hypothetical protein
MAKTIEQLRQERTGSKTIEQLKMERGVDVTSPSSKYTADYLQERAMFEAKRQSEANQAQMLAEQKRKAEEVRRAEAKARVEAIKRNSPGQVNNTTKKAETFYETQAKASKTYAQEPVSTPKKKVIDSEERFTKSIGLFGYRSDQLTKAELKSFTKQFESDPQKAIESFQMMLPELEARKTKKQGFFSRNIQSGVGSVKSDMMDLAATVSEALGFKNRTTGYDAERQALRTQMNTASQMNEAAGPIAKFGGDVVRGVAQAVPALAVTALAGPGAGMAAFGVPASGSYMGEAEAEGASVGKRLAYGAVGGVLEAGLERALGIFNISDTVIKQPLKALFKENLKTVAKEFGKNAAGEGAEEVIANLGMTAAKKLIYDAEAQFDLKGALYEGAVGAAAGGVMQTPSMLANIQNARQAADKIQNEYPETLIAALSLPKETPSYELANRMIKAQHDITLEELDNFQKVVQNDLNAHTESLTKTDMSELKNDTEKRLSDKENAVTIQKELGLPDKTKSAEYLQKVEEQAYYDSMKSKEFLQAEKEYAKGPSKPVQEETVEPKNKITIQKELKLPRDMTAEEFKNKVETQALYDSYKTEDFLKAEREYNRESTPASLLSETKVADKESMATEKTATDEMEKPTKDILQAEPTRSLSKAKSLEKTAMDKRYIDANQNRDGKNELYTNDFPEVKSFHVKRAKELLADLDNTIKGERMPTDADAKEWVGIKRTTSPTIARIKDSTGATYGEIREAITNLINGKNTALARRIEIAIDENLIDGYKTFDGDPIPMNNGYVQLRNKIEPFKIDIPDFEVGTKDATGQDQLKMGLPGENVSMFDTDQQKGVEKRESQKTDDKSGQRDGSKAEKQSDKPIGVQTEEDFKRVFKTAGVESSAKIAQPKKTIHKQAVEIMKELGRDVVFFEGDKNAQLPNGFAVEGSNAIYVNVNQSDNNMMWHTIGHEFFHTIKTNKKYEETIFKPLLEFAKENFDTAAKMKFLDTYSDVPELQAQLMKDEEALLEEMLADEMGNSFVDKTFWQKIYDFSSFLFNDMVEVVKQIMSKITGAKYDTYLSKEMSKRLQDDFVGVVAMIRVENGVVTKKKGETDAQFKIRAYHGTPHDFDKFTTEKMGTGEGVQAYGWGLYFAGKKGIAEWYRDLLSKRIIGTFKKNGVSLDPNNKKAVLEEYFKPGETVDSYGSFKDKVIDFKWNNGDWRVFVLEIGSDGKPTPGSITRGHSTNPTTKEIVDTLTNRGWIQSNNKGRLYEVDLSPDEEHMLDWDEPFSEQSEYVQNKLKPILDKYISTEGVKGFPFSEYYNGKQIYKEAKFKLGSDKEASLFLKSIGIPGIKYLDASSRSAGEKTYNYVVFADEDIEIAAKYSARKKEIETAFKNSKVRNEDGSLKEMYHGTNAEFTEFRPGSAQGWGEGIYFTDNKEATKEFGEKVISAYINITNPYYDSKGITDEQIESTDVYKKKNEVYLSKQDTTSGYDIYDLDGRELFEENGDFANSVIRELGFDGIIADGSNGIEGLEVVVFEPNQIKSPEGNMPVDLKSGDIRYSARKKEIEKTFSNSRIRNDDGSLKLLYHGTKGDFTTFKESLNGEYGRGIYLTDIPETAEWYSKYVSQGEGQPKTIAVYVNMENPKELTKQQYMKLNETKTAKQIQSKFIKEGYDGIIGTGINGSEKQYIVFSPNQIKSAEGDNAVDMANADIMYSHRKLTVRKEAPTEKPSKVETLASLKDQPMPKATGLNADVKGTKKASEIIGDMVEQFNTLLINKQRGTPLGTYHNITHTIRMKKANDMQVFTHEAGHHLDNLYKISSTANGQAEAELLALGEQTSNKNWPKSKKLKEGVAEFLRLYMFDKQTAMKRVPNALNHFEYKVDKDMMKLVNKWADESWKLYNLAPVDRISKSIVFATEKPGIQDVLFNKAKVFDPENIGYLAHIAYEGIFDQTHMLEYFVGKMGGQKAQEFMKQQLAKFRGYEAVSTNDIYYSQNDLNGREVGDSYRDITKEVHTSEAKRQDFIKYQVARRAEDYEAKGLELPDSYETYKAAVIELEAKYPEFKKVFSDLIEYRANNLHLLGDIYGVENIDKMIEENPNYAPLKRDFGQDSKTAVGVGKRLAGSKKLVKGLRGGGQDISDVEQSDIANTFMYRSAAMRNKILLELVDVGNSVEGFGNVIQRADPKFKVAEFTLEQLKGQLNKLDIDVDGVDPETAMRIIKPNYLAGENQIVVYRDGKPEVYDVHPDLYASLSGMSPELGGMVIQVMAAISTVQKAGIVLSQKFITYNFGRDTNRSSISTNAGINPFSIMVGVGSSLVKGENYKRALAAGALSGFFVNDRNNIARTIDDINAGSNPAKQAMKFIKHPTEIFRFVSDAVEFGPKVAEFNAYLKKFGYTQEQIDAAVVSTRNLSYDYKMMGRWVKKTQWNRVANFFNPQLQGVKNTILLFRTPKLAFRTTVKGIIYTTIPTLLLMYLNRDNEYYKELPQWRRDFFWNVPLGDPSTTEVFLPIPKDFEFGILFGALPERLINDLYYEDKHAWDGIMDTIAKTILPEFMPSALTPMYELQVNKNFLGRPILSKSDEGLFPEEQYNEFTSEVAKGISKAVKDLPVPRSLKSPKQVQHLIEGYGTTVARNVLQGIDLALEGDVAKGVQTGLGFNQSMTVNALKSPESVERFYNNKSNIDKLYRSLKKGGKKLTPETDALKDEFSSAYKDLDDLNDFKRAIERGDKVEGYENLTKEQIKETVKKANLKIIEITQRVNTLYDKYYTTEGIKK